MLLIKRICQFLQRPVFEVMTWPVSELEYWSIFFSIDDNKDKPIIKKLTPETVTLEQSKRMMRDVLG